MKKSRIIAVICAALAIVWIVSGLLFGGGGTDGPAPDQPPVPLIAGEQAKGDVPAVRVTRSSAEPYSSRLNITGRSQASRSVSMKAETSGQIMEIIVDEGANVVAGDLLARIETRDRQVRVSEAAERVHQREIQYTASETLESKGFNSRIRLAEAKAELEAARAVLKTAQIDLDKTKIKAPIKGVVFTQSIERGDYVGIGDALYTIIDLDPIEFVGYVAEQKIGDLLPGQEASVTVQGLNEPLDGVVSYIAPAADPQTRTFRILVKADNPDGRVREGITADIGIPVADTMAHFISPAILSLTDQGDVGVKIVNADNMVEFVPVDILADTPEGMWVSGPAPEAVIITIGQDFVTAGQTVNPVEAESIE